MRFIGDVHGHIAQYVKLTEQCEASVQVGDLGAGFVPLPTLAATHRFIRGNHDDPSVCIKHPNFITDGCFENNIFYVGGAYSIDRQWRTIGVNWWDDEELSHDDFQIAIERYLECKPRVMVTHDAPYSVSRVLFPEFQPISSRTSNWLEYMFERHKPKYWLFGHWHQRKQMNILGTEFICLGELDHIDLDL